MPQGARRGEARLWPRPPERGKKALRVPSLRQVVDPTVFLSQDEGQEEIAIETEEVLDEIVEVVEE